MRNTLKFTSSIALVIVLGIAAAVAQPEAVMLASCDNGDQVANTLTTDRLAPEGAEADELAKASADSDAAFDAPEAAPITEDAVQIVAQRALARAADGGDAKIATHTAVQRESAWDGAMAAGVVAAAGSAVPDAKTTAA